MAAAQSKAKLLRGIGKPHNFDRWARRQMKRIYFIGQVDRQIRELELKLGLPAGSPVAATEPAATT